MTASATAAWPSPASSPAATPRQRSSRLPIAWHARSPPSSPEYLDNPRIGDRDDITRNRTAIRFLLLALAIPQALIGLWALLAPSSFYDDFPTGTDGWVNVLGPFDEHLVTDVGALFIALGFLLAYAAVNLSRPLVNAAAIAWLLFSVPHFLWHVANLEPYGTADAIGNTATLAWTVIGAALILFLARRSVRAQP